MTPLPEHVDIRNDLSDKGFAFVFAMGFEERALALPTYAAISPQLRQVVAIKYVQPKGQNKETEAKQLWERCNAPVVTLQYSLKKAYEFEYKLLGLARGTLRDIEDIVLDISAMSKFLILVAILVLLRERKRIRIVCTAAAEYAPSRAEYEAVVLKLGDRLTSFAGQPSSGVSEILRSACMSSTRMQGQPVCAVAFTSFNEELIRHCVGSLNPHRLILLNGIPPNPDFMWRAFATQHIHKRLIEEYSDENPISESSGLLNRSISTFDYRETVDELLRIRRRFGTYERLIYFATGSKMQTVGLALLKAAFEDVHIEYPIPDSYFFQEYSKGVGLNTMVIVDGSTVEKLRGMT